ncbi:hypothetical protein [Flavobacterium piscis]|uniref:Outer membrane protein beta-barrel domain-containing protein n=1 Tax=Flavobacterium piscis TaxID=1114874 RepID=A0ABU1YAY5_9FLAO|nr:hypothetical protein [Flavobacterium piscis]MDR7211401.1 hypothetical protein [Flavobacterium piscis]
MKKQNIEDIFSSMENFSSVPPPELWDNIEEKLRQAKKKKAAVIWWSIAASLLIGLSVPSVLYLNSGSEISNPKNNSIQNNSVVIEENNRNSNKNKTRSADNNNASEETVKSNKNTDINIVSSEEKKSTQSNHNIIISNQNTTNGIVSIQEKDWNAKTNSNKNPNPKDHQNPNLYNDKNSLFRNKKETVAHQNTAVNNASKQEKDLTDKTYNQHSNSKQNQGSFVYNNKSLKNEEKTLFNSNNQDVNNVFNPKDKNVIIASNTIENNTITTKRNKTELKTETSTTEKAIATTIENKSKSGILTVEDSVQLAELQNLEKSIAASKTKKEEEIKPVSNADKWSLELFAGVANSENIGKDKTLGNVNQSKQTNTYGVKTNYKLNKKWAVSSGLKINELGQSIANVSYMNAQNNAFLSSSDYFIKSTTTTTAPQITNNANYVFVSNNAKNSLKSDNFQTGNIDQSLKYIEMPLEISYALFNKNKTSISLNTGGFVGKLISNNVFLDGTSIGSNLDANDFVYGSLLSSTLQYRLYKKTHVFVEPGMNYYINPLSSQSFNQFQWAFNFGLNVSF